MRPRNPILFSLCVTVAPLGLGMVWLGLDEICNAIGLAIGLAFTGMALMYLYLFVMPIVAIGSFLYMSSRKKEWNRKYGWVVILYTLLAVEWYKVLFDRLSGLVY